MQPMNYSEMGKICRLLGNQDAIIERLEAKVNSSRISIQDKEPLLTLIQSLKDKSAEIFESIKVYE